MLNYLRTHTSKKRKISEVASSSQTLTSDMIFKNIFKSINEQSLPTKENFLISTKTNIRNPFEFINTFVSKNANSITQRKSLNNSEVTKKTITNNDKRKKIILRKTQKLEKDKLAKQTKLLQKQQQQLLKQQQKQTKKKYTRSKKIQLAKKIFKSEDLNFASSASLLSDNDDDENDNNNYSEIEEQQNENNTNNVNNENNTLETNQQPKKRARKEKVKKEYPNNTWFVSFISIYF
jgi:hypothetical protein